ncbi:MAG: UvrD-helicase domain-containing protein [Planctomycetota bacterium]|nr:UvrD-helicase domain-containing protein [Planctomycetota bacterium]MDA1137560.1 UvrD-helicase domain-containing protein [Planctomycetota bacterium]
MHSTIPLERILQDVNPAQAEAIKHVEGPLLVLAGAGSGKTRVVTRRVTYLISQGVRPSQILAITFTNKAAGEMRKRVEAMVPEGRLNVSTFHSFGARMLRQYINRIGRENTFTIFDEDDRLKLVKEAIKKVDVDTANFAPSSLAATISRAKNELLNPEEFGKRETDYYGRIAASVYRHYEKLLEQNNALDFDDLLVKFLQVMVDCDEVLERLQQQFRFVLIDEYQDTNRAQYYLAQMLAARHRNLHVTGDPDQSIYSWRGADIKNILAFEEDYPESKVVRLEQNYRSTKTILAAANSVIQNNKQRKEKSLWTENEDGQLLTRMNCEDETHEADLVAERIKELAQGSQFNYSDIAIFYRTNAQSRVLEQSLIRDEIPYVIVGGVAFYERKEVKDVLAYVRCVVNPRDSVSLRRIINVPTRGIGQATIESLIDYAESSEGTILDALKTSAAIGLSKRAVNAAQKFAALYDTLTGVPLKPVAAFFQRVLDLTKYVEFLENSNDEKSDDRIENVLELISAAEAYDQAYPDGDVRGFLEQSVLVQQLDSYDETQARVTLMTLHLAKGLEYPVVFLIGMEEGLLPHMNSMESLEKVEEERRLAYVGITRAESRLFISCAQERRQFGQYFNNMSSRFLREIPEDLIHEENALNEDEGDFGSDSDLVFEIGDRVRHHHFGVGTVVDVEYGNFGEQLKIRFQKSGVKRLDPEVAGLELLA